MCSLSSHSLGDSSLWVSTRAPPSLNSSSLPVYLPSSLNRSMSLQLPLPSHFEISQATYLPEELKLWLNICYIYLLGFMSPPHDCTHLTCQQSNAQNSPSQASAVHELLDVQAGFRKGRGTRDQIANIHWIIKKAREFQKNIHFCFIYYAKAFDCQSLCLIMSKPLTVCCVDHNKLWKILREMGIPDCLTCLLRNLYAGQKTTVRGGGAKMAEE